jgi:hypothetical protein
MTTQRVRWTTGKPGFVVNGEHSDLCILALDLVTYFLYAAG